MGELPKGWNILDTIDEKDDTSDEETIQPVLPQLSEEDKSFQQTIYDFLSKKGMIFLLRITVFPVISTFGVYFIYKLLRCGAYWGTAL